MQLGLNDQFKMKCISMHNNLNKIIYLIIYFLTIDSIYLYRELFYDYKTLPSHRKYDDVLTWINF